MGHGDTPLIDFTRMDGQRGGLTADQIGFVVWVDELRGRIHAKSGTVIHITDVEHFVTNWRRSRL
jgi:hypothetical protein